MTDTPKETESPPLVVGQEGWYIPRDHRRGGLKSEGRPAKVEDAGKLWATVKPEGSQTVKVLMRTGVGYRSTSSANYDGQWMSAEAYALWLAKARADSERGELVEALRVKGIIVNSSVKTDVLPRLLAALEQ